jgi:ubiquinone/menaquinone biosynthesis C-methylase UbiE
MKDPRARFSETVENYDRYRPTYPEALVDWTLEPFGGRAPRVLDLGCGTGISTRLFSTRAKSIVGIDPNDAMLERARAKGGAEYRKGEATKTGLDDRSLDLVIAGQAFHWFDLEATLDELARVLVPSGWCAAFWNMRAATPFLDAYEALLVSASKEYREMPGHAETYARLRGSGRFADVRERSFEHAQRFDRDGLFGRAYSSSFVVHGIDDRDRFDRELDALFDRFAERGEVEFRYRADAIMGHPVRR